jgi:hypothetical protein
MFLAIIAASLEIGGYFLPIYCRLMPYQFRPLVIETERGLTVIPLLEENSVETVNHATTIWQSRMICSCTVLGIFSDHTEKPKWSIRFLPNKDECMPRCGIPQIKA